MELPPLLAGGAQEIVACSSPATAVTLVGAPGSVAGVTGLVASEAGPAPRALIATTVNVYATPLLRPLTVVVVVSALTGTLCPPGEAVTV
jgi:hypothetical protein